MYESIDSDFFAEQSGAFWISTFSYGLSSLCFVHSFISVSCMSHLVNRVINVEVDPWRSYHVERVPAFLVSPVGSNFAQHESHQVVVVVHQCVHVRMQSLGGVHISGIEFNFNKVVRVSSDDKVDVIPVRQQDFLK